MAGPNSAVSEVDGSLDFSGGVNSVAVSTVQSRQVPNGLPRNCLAWLINGTVRDGGITTRYGLEYKLTVPLFVAEPVIESITFRVDAIGAASADAPAGSFSTTQLGVTLSFTQDAFTFPGAGESVTVPVTAATYTGTLPSPALNLTGLTFPLVAVTATVTGIGYQAVSGNDRFQGEYLYQPQSGTPYHIMSISGRIYKVDVEANTVVDLSTLFGLTNPPDEPYAYFVQGKRFLVIQAGDNVTLPLFWDGVTLRRSNGLGSVTTVANTVTIKNDSDAANVGATIPGGQGVYGSGFQVGISNSFVVPAVGGTVVVNGDVIGTLPTASFKLILTTAPVTYTPVAYQVTAESSGVVSSNNPELPAATAMDYFMGRIWYALGDEVAAGDIVKGPSGTLPYDFDDAILKVTENPVALGGDGFTIPDNSGTIRALKHNANLDAVLGQGTLFPFTSKTVCSLQVPVTRDDWIAADANNQPKLSVVQLVNGAVNDRSITAVNGDLFYQSLEPSIRSLITAVRDFGEWGNIPLSANELLVWRSNNRALMSFASGITFDNRMLQTVLPETLGDNVVSKGIIPLDFVPISTFKTQLAPAWEGVYEGYNWLQLSQGNYGGRERAFATVISAIDGSIQVHEITSHLRHDLTTAGENRVTMVIRFPAFTWNGEFTLKTLLGAEIWVDRVYGEVEFLLEWRPDGDTCWHKWHQWKICSARNCLEDTDHPCEGYPVDPVDYGEGFRSTMSMPKPPENCDSLTGRPAHIGYQFQVQLTVKGFCRIRGLMEHASERERRLYEGLTC